MQVYAQCKLHEVGKHINSSSWWKTKTKNQGLSHRHIKGGGEGEEYTTERKERKERTLNENAKNNG